MKSKMIGKFFHSKNEKGMLKYQGRIIDQPSKDMFMVEIYDWFMGDKQSEQLVSFIDMKNWIFYDSSELMQHSYEHGAAREFRHDLVKESVSE